MGDLNNELQSRQLHQMSAVDGRRDRPTRKLAAIRYSAEILNARTSAQAAINFVHRIPSDAANIG